MFSSEKQTGRSFEVNIILNVEDGERKQKLFIIIIEYNLDADVEEV